MKQNMKRVLSVLCMITCLFLLSACGSKETKATSELDAGMTEALEQLGRDTLQQFAVMTKEQSGTTREQAEKSKNTALVTGLDSWENVKDELGAFVSVDSVQIEEAEDGFMVEMRAKFEKRDMVFSMGINEDVSAYTSLTFSPVYTVMENMTKAALNTLMGMGTVFVVLIFISLLIGCFKYINAWEKRKSESLAQIEKDPISASAAPTLVQEEELVDDFELAAVITAAIAASEGTSADGLVVRSIRRAPAGKWKKAN